MHFNGQQLFCYLEYFSSARIISFPTQSNMDSELSSSYKTHPLTTFDWYDGGGGGGARSHLFRANQKLYRNFLKEKLWHTCGDVKVMSNKTVCDEREGSQYTKARRDKCREL